MNGLVVGLCLALLFALVRYNWRAIRIWFWLAIAKGLMR